jgi:hypothetical protein
MKIRVSSSHIMISFLLSSWSYNLINFALIDRFFFIGRFSQLSWGSRYSRNLRIKLFSDRERSAKPYSTYSVSSALTIDDIIAYVDFWCFCFWDVYRLWFFALIIREHNDLVFDILSCHGNSRFSTVPLGTISPAASPAFVVWRKGKPRVVIDLRRINIKIYSDAYSLLKQNTIFSSLDDSIVFSSINLIKEFFQQSIDSKDYWKTTFVSQHRDLEWLTISSMSLDNNSNFFQHKMKRVLKKYLWKFVLVYIDDIIIFFTILENHLKYLNEILVLLKKSDVILSLSKSHFDYSSIKILKHHVNRLKISIMKKKIAIIKNLKFFVTLKNLKKELDFFEYYRNFVSWYSFIEKSLIKLKTQIFKKFLKKDKQRLEWALKTYLEQSDLDLTKSEYQKNSRKIKSFKICINAWKELKKQLCNAIIKIFSKFSRFFILYVDENKKRNFEIAFHQIEKNDVKRFILFFFQKSYWSRIEILSDKIKNDDTRLSFDEVVALLRWWVFHCHHWSFRVEINASDSNHRKKISKTQWMSYVLFHVLVKNDDYSSIRQKSFQCKQIVKTDFRRRR